MTAPALHSSSEAAWRLVGRQHGVIAWRQLRALGFSAHAIRHRVATGRLHRVHRGVYVVGRPELSGAGRWMAAVLACGDEAALGYAAGAELFGVAAMRPGERIAVCVPAAVFRTVAGLEIHRRGDAVMGSATTRRDIPVTSIASTLVDLATVRSRDEVEAAVNEADRLNLIDPETLRLRLEDLARVPGVAVLRSILDRRTFTLTDSQLERRFAPIVRTTGLPRALTREWVNGFRVDFFWPQLGLVVETDGLRYHRTPAQQARDRLRDQTHTAAGLTPLRFTRAQIRFEPAYVAATLASVARRLAKE